MNSLQVWLAPKRWRPSLSERISACGYGASMILDLGNRPFGVSDWFGRLRRDDQRWEHGIPPLGNADYAWIQHFLGHLAPSGTAGFVMANGSARPSNRAKATSARQSSKRPGGLRRRARDMSVLADSVQRLYDPGEEAFMIELTELQMRALENPETTPPRVVNPRTKETFVLLHVEEYERLKEGAYDDSPWTSEELQALAWEAGKRMGWEDTDEYDDPEKP